MRNFKKIAQELVEHFGLLDLANETEIKALSYALEDCCKMYCESATLSNDQISSFKAYIVDYHIKGDNEPDNEQSVEDIVYSLYDTMLTVSIPEILAQELGVVNGDFAINDIQMGIDGKYQVSFLCGDADQLLQDLEYFIINGNKLNEYSKFALRNTDNFYDLEEILKEIEKDKNEPKRKTS